MINIVSHSQNTKNLVNVGSIQIIVKNWCLFYLDFLERQSNFVSSIASKYST